MRSRGDPGAVGSIVLAVRFLLELGALAALAYWGFRTGGATVTRVILGIGTPAAAAALWGIFVAPKAMIRVSGPVRALFEALVFGGAVAALVAAGATAVAVVFGALALADGVLVRILRL